MLKLKSKTLRFPLNIVDTQIEKKHGILFLYMIITTRLLHTQRWENMQISTRAKWMVKLMELAEKAILMKNKNFLALFPFGNHFWTFAQKG